MEYRFARSSPSFETKCCCSGGLAERLITHCFGGLRFFLGLCRQNSLANVSLLKYYVSDFLHCLDHPDPVFFSGDAVTILSHFQLFSGFPFLVVESCCKDVSELQCSYCSCFGKPKNERVCRLENEISFLGCIVPKLFPELLVSSSSARTVLEKVMAL